MNIGQWYSYNGTPASSTSTHKAGIDVMVVSQNKINNTSLVRIRPWIMKLSGSGFWHYNSQTMTIKANNVSRTTKTQYDFRDATTDDKEFLTSDYPFKRISGSGSLVSGAYVYDFTITHNNDGSKTIPIYALIPLASSNGTNWTVDEDIELPTIPRANTLTYSYTYIDEEMTFSISKADDDFTTTIIGITFNSDGTNNPMYIAEKNKNKTIKYTLNSESLKSILSANKDTNKIEINLYVYTYLDNTELGGKTYSISIPIKQINPSVGTSVKDTNSISIALTGDETKIMKYISKPKVTITAIAQQEADIAKYSIIWGNSSGSSQEKIFSNGIDSEVLKITVTDSRKWSTTRTYDFIENNRFIDYIKLGFEKFTLERPETTSNTINANLNGVWFNGNFGVSTNTIELKFRYKEKNGEYSEYQNISLTTENNTFNFTGTLGSNYEYQKQYDFEFVLSDKVMSLVATFNATSGESIIRVAETYVRILGDLIVKGEKINKEIGDIVITSTNTNPSSRLGGSWELVDKEFINIGTSSVGFEPSDNIKNVTASFTRSGHSIILNLAFTTNSELSDTTVLLGTLNFEELGVTKLGFNVRDVGFSDPGNSILMLYVSSSTGELSCVDIVGASTVAADNTCYATITFQFFSNYMLDEACDKFYWKKVA